MGGSRIAVGPDPADRPPRQRRGSKGVRTEQQAHLLAELRQRVRDERVLAAMRDVPRECFVAPDDLEHACDNRPLQIGCGQTISQPLVVARMCELLELSAEDRALDVGTGSGYHAAILAQLCREVWSVEVHPELSAQARDNLAAAGIFNVRLVVADGSRGYPPKAPYDAINVAAAARRVIPQPLVDQLAPRGRLVLPVRRRGQRLVRVRHTAAGLTTETFERVRFVPLVTTR